MQTQATLRTSRGFKTEPRSADCEKLPFSAWELAAMENALRYYADNYGLNTDLVRRHTLALADRISNANPAPEFMP